MQALHSMKKMLQLKPSAEILDYIIRSKHRVLSIIRDNQAILMFPVSEYAGISYDPETNVVKVSYKNHNDLKTIMIDFKEKDSDVLGFENMEAACDYLYNDETLIIRPIQYNDSEFKLIFSPQLAKWLIRHKYIVWDIKENRNKPDEIIFVFKVEDGFYETINEFKNQTKR